MVVGFNQLIDLLENFLLLCDLFSRSILHLQLKVVMEGNFKR